MAAPTGIMASAKRVTATSVVGLDAQPTKEKAPVESRATEDPGYGLIHQFTPSALRTYSTASKAAGFARPDTTPERGVRVPTAGNAVIVIVTAPDDGAGELFGVLGGLLTGEAGGLLTGEAGGVAAGEPPVNPGGYCAAATSTPA